MEGPKQTIPLVDLRAHHEPIREEIDQAIRRVIDDSSFIRGAFVKSFESRFAEFAGTKHCVGVGNGTDALTVALMALGIGAGHEVITVANSFIATSEAITRCGADIVFVDCDPQTYTIDVQHVAESITEKTRAIIPVHLYGQPADMDPIQALAREHALCVVEDAAQAHGAKYRGRQVGTLGDCACFSFFPGKNLGALGDAGAVVTNHDSAARKIGMLANHGREGKFNHQFEGLNSRLDGLQAAVLEVKLKHLEHWNNRRREIARMYDEALVSCCITPRVRSDVEHVYHLYVVQVPQRDEVQAELASRGVATGIHYPVPLPLLDAYRDLGHGPEDFPVANMLKNTILSLPIHGAMTDQQVGYVIEHFTDVVHRVEGGTDDPQQAAEVRLDRLWHHSA